MISCVSTAAVCECGCPLTQHQFRYYAPLGCLTCGECCERYRQGSQWPTPVTVAHETPIDITHLMAVILRLARDRLTQLLAEAPYDGIGDDILAVKFVTMRMGEHPDGLDTFKRLVVDGRKAGVL